VSAAAATLVAAPPLSVLGRAWFDRSAAEVAPELLGCRLVRDTPDGPIRGRIVEVEAYLGPEDRAAHSWHGLTPRTATLFGAPGHLYVYLVYGLHHCLNVVCGPGSKPEAVLLRAAQIISGEDLARSRRGAVATHRLAAGPGNLGSAFGVDRRLDGSDLLDGPIRIEPGPRPARIVRGPRVGVAYAGAWAARPLRFMIDDAPPRPRP